MEIENKKVWVVMDKKRTVIAKGNVRDRHLVRLDNEKCKKRYLTYNTKGKAEASFSGKFVYNGSDLVDGMSSSIWEDRSKFLEAVECEMIINVLYSVSSCYWEKPKKIELNLENMASGEMIGNIKGLKK